MADILIVYSVLQWPPVATVQRLAVRLRASFHGPLLVSEPRASARSAMAAHAFASTPLCSTRRCCGIGSTHRDSRDICDALRRLRGRWTPRVALPQDEYLCSRALVDLIDALEIDHVFSVAPESEWDNSTPASIGTASASPASSPATSPETRSRGSTRSSARQGERPIAIGYRARGVRGRRSGATAGSRPRSPSAFRSAAVARGPRRRHRGRRRGTIRGDDWYRFLADCRYTLGVEGGASVHDPDGALQGACVVSSPSIRTRRSRR